MWKFKMIYLFIYIYEHKRSETEFHGIKVYANVEAPEAPCLRSDEIRLSTCLKVCHLDSHSCITVHGIFSEGYNLYLTGLADQAVGSNFYDKSALLSAGRAVRALFPLLPAQPPPSICLLIKQSSAAIEIPQSSIILI